MRDLLHDNRGTTSVEYIVLFITLGLPLALALAWAGPHLLQFFEVRVAWLSLSIP